MHDITYVHYMYINAIGLQCRIYLHVEQFIDIGFRGIPGDETHARPETAGHARLQT